MKMKIIKFIRFVAWSALGTAIAMGIILVAIAMALVSGCSINSSKEKAEFNLKLPAGQLVEFVSDDGQITQTKLLQDQTVPVTYSFENWQGLFLYFTTEKDIYRETPFSIFQVGSITSIPDANSIESVSSGLTKIGIKAITGF